MGFHINILKVKLRNKIVKIAKKLENQFLPVVHGTTICRQFVKLTGKFSSEIQCNLCKNLRIFRMYNFFEKFMFVEILTSEDENFRNSTFNNIKKLCRQIIGVISKPFS